MTTSGKHFRVSSLVVELTVFSLAPSEKNSSAEEFSAKGEKTYKIVMFYTIAFGSTKRRYTFCANAHAGDFVATRALYADFVGGFAVLCSTFAKATSWAEGKNTPPFPFPPLVENGGRTKKGKNLLLTNRKKRCIIAMC